MPRTFCTRFPCPVPHRGGGENARGGKGVSERSGGLRDPVSSIFGCGGVRFQAALSGDNRGLCSFWTVDGNLPGRLGGLGAGARTPGIERLQSQPMVSPCLRQDATCCLHAPLLCWGLHPRRFLATSDKPLVESHVLIPRYLDLGSCQALHYRLALSGSTFHVLILGTLPSSRRGRGSPDGMSS